MRIAVNKDTLLRILLFIGFLGFLIGLEILWVVVMGDI